MNAAGTPVILPALLETVVSGGKHTAKLGALEVIQQLITSAPAQMALQTPAIVPVLAGSVHDTKKEVQKLSKDVLKTTCALCENPGAYTRDTGQVV